MNEYDKKMLQKQIEIYKKLQIMYEKASEEIIKRVTNKSISNEELFLFSKFEKRYFEEKKKVEYIITELNNNVNSYIKEETRTAWDISNEKNARLLLETFTEKGLKVPVGMKQRNIADYETFVKRQTNGLTISDRVWNISGNLKDEIQQAINAGIASSADANEIAKNIKKYLNNPNARIRRVRDKQGNLKVSAKDLKHKPGKGVYRSAFKNAYRLARTEVTRAYRESDYERWQAMPFVIGYKIQNSTRIETICDICKGHDGHVYPKWYKWVGFHPQCLCTAIPVIADDETVEKISKGEEVDKSKLTVDTKDIEKQNEAETRRALGITNSDKKDIEDIEDIKSILDGNKSNIHYPEKGYDENCQAAVVAYEMLRRGFNVTAKKYEESKTNVPYKISNDVTRPWIDPTTGFKPRKIFSSSKDVENPKNIVSFIKNETKEQGRYHFNVLMKNKYGGNPHAIVAERTKDNTLIICDPQNGEKYKIEEFAKRISKRGLIFIYRVDNVMVNTEIINDIVEPIND